MKFVTLRKDNGAGLGVKVEEGIIDLNEAAKAHGIELPQQIMQVIEGGTETVRTIRDFLESFPIEDNCTYLLDESRVSYGPCVTHPSKMICVGLNYRKHAQETNAAIPTSPILFNKFPNSLTGHNSEVAIPEVTEKLDYEAELVIVIGKEAKNVPKEKALDYVFGYCNANDLSARDLQLLTPQWMLGKTCDGFCPTGPYLVTADEVGHPNQLRIETMVNGEVRQSSHTSDMIFACDEIISYISRHMTLHPGDMILTGTPEGVVLGYPPERQQYLKDGDVVSVEIEKLGRLSNRFIAAK